MGLIISKCIRLYRIEPLIIIIKLPCTTKKSYVNYSQQNLCMKRGIFFGIIAITVFTTIISCRKPVEKGKEITVSGLVFDPVKNKPLPNATLYLFGAHATFYGIYYSQGPFDSVITDNAGKFALRYTAEGSSIDYGLTLGQLQYGGYNYGGQTNYVVDYTEPVYKLNYGTAISNAVVKARELNFSKIHLKVQLNPFDSFYVRTLVTGDALLIKGQSIDTNVYVRHLPYQQNIIEYYTQSTRDTVGLAALNSNPNNHFFSITRMLRDTFTANLSDTIFLNKTIANSSLMPRQ